MISKEEIELLKSQSKLPFIQSAKQGCVDQKVFFQSKQSDFIKKLKKTKTIMLAHQNRKQKVILSSYYTNKKSNINIESSRKNISMMSEQNGHTRSFSQQIHLQKLLFPPVHSVQLCQYTNQPIQSKQKVLNKKRGEKVLKKNPATNRIRDILQDRQDFQVLKCELKQVKKSDTERQTKNYTEMEANFLGNSSSEKKITLKKHKLKTKIPKFLKHYTDIQKTNESDIIGGWDTRKEEENEVLDKYHF